MDKSENIYIDPSTNRKKDVVEKNLQYHQSMPLFSLLEFNIFGACNRSCEFCPVSDTSFYKNVYQGIDLELFLDRLWMMGRLEKVYGGAEISYSPNPSWLEMK